MPARPDLRLLLLRHTALFEGSLFMLMHVVVGAAGKLGQAKHVLGPEALRVVQIALTILVSARQGDGMIRAVFALVAPNGGFQGAFAQGFFGAARAIAVLGHGWSFHGQALVGFQGAHPRGFPPLVEHGSINIGCHVR